MVATESRNLRVAAEDWGRFSSLAEDLGISRGKLMAELMLHGAPVLRLRVLEKRADDDQFLADSRGEDDARWPRGLRRELVSLVLELARTADRARWFDMLVAEALQGEREGQQERLQGALAAWREYRAGKSEKEHTGAE